MKNRSEKHCIWVVGICIVALFVLVSISTVRAAEAPIELKLAAQYPPQSLPGSTMQYFADLVQKRSNGRVKITVYPSNTLVPVEKAYEAGVTGISEIINCTPAYTAGRFPANDATLVPLAIKTAWTFTHTAQDFYDKFKAKEFDDTHVLFFNSCGPYVLMSKTKPILKPEDMKGMKLRAAGVQAGEIVKALGGTPVSVSMSEAYEAISKGVVDGLVVPAEALKPYKLADVTKYMTRLPLSFSNPNLTTMNKKKWESLPPDIQKIITDAAKEMVEVGAKAWWYGDIVGEEYFLGLGGGRKIYEIPRAEFPAWEKPLAPIRAAYVEKNKNLPGNEYIKYLDERTEYWNGRQPDKKAVVEWVEKNLLKSK